MLYAGPKLENEAGTDAFEAGGTPASPGWQETATGTGSSQTITLPEAITAAALAVYVNGLRSLPSEYSVTGTTLTITTPAGASILAEKPAVSGSGGGATALYVQQTRPSAPGPWQWWQTDAGGNIINLTINDGTP